MTSPLPKVIREDCCENGTNSNHRFGGFPLKQMRAADFLGRLPQAPSRRQSAAPLLLLFRLRHKRHSVPPKESNACLYFVRGCLPQSLHSPQLSEPDPIYPYLPFLFCSSLWQRACHQGRLDHTFHSLAVFTGSFASNGRDSFVRKRTQARHICTRSIQHHCINDRLSLARPMAGLR